MIEKNVFMVLKYRCRQPVRASSKTNKTVTLLDEKGVIPAKQVLNVGIFVATIARAPGGDLRDARQQSIASTTA
jgi:hypothetical protein